MELIIGRDKETSRLKVVDGTQVTMIGAPASVHDDVSRQHCLLTVLSENELVIKNIKAANVTWVNGVEVQSKRITASDKVQLGPSRRYTLPLAEILEKCKPNIADIRSLRTVWDNYNNSLIAIRKRQQRNNLLSRVPIAFTMLGGLLSALSETIRPYSIAFTVIAIIIMAYGFYRIAVDKSIEEQERLKKQLQNDYVCPKCKRFLGFQDYELLSQNSHCPYCKAEFVK